LNGKEEGIATFWYSTGQKKCEDFYKNGEMNGVCVLFRENGSKKEETTYSNGKFVSRESFKNIKVVSLPLQQAA